jgi:transposase-like protein
MENEEHDCMDFAQLVQEDYGYDMSMQRVVKRFRYKCKKCGDGWNEDVYPEFESRTTSSFSF